MGALPNALVEVEDGTGVGRKVGITGERKVALGLTVQETFVPQSYDWGVEAQVDWYDAYADLAGERTKLQGFSMRSMASGAAFHCAFLHATQQAFLEGQVKRMEKTTKGGQSGQNDADSRVFARISGDTRIRLVMTS
jgi:hypothetical protein